MKHSFKLFVAVVFIMHMYSVKASDHEGVFDLEIDSLSSISSNSSVGSFCISSDEDSSQEVNSPSKRSRINQSSSSVSDKSNENRLLLMSKFKQDPEKLFTGIITILSDHERKMDHNFTGLHNEMKQNVNKIVEFLKGLDQRISIQDHNCAVLAERQEKAIKELKKESKKQKQTIDDLKRIVTSQEIDIQATKKRARDLSEKVATIENGDQSNNKYYTRLESERKKNSRYND